MKLFWTAILCVLIGLGPIWPQSALAAPLLGKSKSEQAARKAENSFQVANLGTEEEPLMVLFAHVHERASVRKTLKDIKPEMEDAAREFPDLRFVSITIHPKDDPKTPQDESLNDPIMHKFWRGKSSEKLVAEEIGVETRKIHSFEKMQLPMNTHRVPSLAQEVINHTTEFQPGDEHAPSFLKFLTPDDLAKLKFSRPRTDVATSLIRGGMTGAGIAAGLALTGEVDPANMAIAASIPTAVAFAAGMKNEWLADFEQTSHVLKFRNWIREKRNKEPIQHSKFLKPIEGIMKNVGLAFTYVAALKVSMLWADHEDAVSSAWGFIGKTAEATGYNIYKKTFIIRALHTWTHNMYKKHPRKAAYFARINAWSMAFIGGVITGTDTLQFLPDNEVAQASLPWINSGLFLAGLGAYVYVTGGVKKVKDWTKGTCSKLFKSTPPDS